MNPDRTPPVVDITCPDIGVVADVVRELFREYAAFLGDEFVHAGFEEELAALERLYSAPRGTLFLAEARAGAGAMPGAVGCVGVRRHEPGICVMRRMYVRPAHRGLGLGRRLAEAAIAAGRAMGHGRMRLDTLPRLEAAVALYTALGFREIPPCWENPVPGVRFFELDLNRPSGATT